GAAGRSGGKGCRPWCGSVRRVTFGRPTIRYGRQAADRSPGGAGPGRRFSWPGEHFPESSSEDGAEARRDRRPLAAGKAPSSAGALVRFWPGKGRLPSEMRGIKASWKSAILVVDRDLSEMLEQEGILAARI